MLTTSCGFTLVAVMPMKNLSLQTVEFETDIIYHKKVIT